MMQYVGDWHLVPGPGADHVAIGARRVDDVLANDVALICRDAPLTRGQQLYVNDAGAPQHLGAEIAGTHRHRDRHVRRRDVAVGNGKEPYLDVADLEERVQVPDLIRPYDVRFVAGELGETVDLLAPVDLLVVTSEADAATAVPTHRVARQRLELRIELGAIDVDACHIERGVEVRTLPGSMPSRAGGKLALLDEYDVCPTLECEMVEDPCPHHPTSDDHDPRMCSQGDLILVILKGARWRPPFAASTFPASASIPLSSPGVNVRPPEASPVGC